MKKRNKIIVLVLILVIAVACIVIWWSINGKLEKENTTSNGTDIYDKNVINDIKKEINATGNTDIYQIEQEYDGRQILQIRPNIQFETVLAGILKNSQPAEDEIQELLESKPTKNGIWIAKQARDKFLSLLKENGINDYSINEDGYLNKTDTNAQEETKKINTAIQSNQLFIIDISGISYIRDEISGEIGEYPFEKMEPYQAVDVYEDGNRRIIEITTNEKGQLTNQEILSDVLLNISL